MNEFRKVHQYNCFSTNSPVQFALAEFLKEKNVYLDLSGFLQTKRDYFNNLMKQTKFKPVNSSGSYFQIYDYSDISDDNENDFALRLIKEFGIVTIPVSSFYKNGNDNKVLRFCFAKKESTLDEAVRRLLKFTR
jgi:methionine aminotransferase